MTAWSTYSSGAAQAAGGLFSYAEGAARGNAASAASIAAALASSVAAPPSIDVNFAMPSQPAMPPLPTAPSMSPITFSMPSAPTGAVESAPALSIGTFDEAAPIITLPDAPSVNYGTAPAVPAIGVVAVPDAPEVLTPSTPAYLAVSSHSLGAIDLHEDWLTRLEEIPTLELLSPTPYSYSPSPKYASALLDALKDKVRQRLEGGTGLPPAVEQAIWDRARDRETSIAQANVDEIQRHSEALGFRLPAGVTVAQTRQAQQSYYDKLSELSRDVSIKQADLEQANLKHAIEEGLKLESQLLDYAMKLEQIGFESAKFGAENAIQAYNAVVDAYKASLSGYQTYAQAYETVIKAELSQIEIFKGKLAGEETKANINRTLVEQYKAAIDAGMAQVKVYEAQVGGAKALIELEATKLGAAGEQIKAYVAQVNAETAKVEAYKASVQGEATKIEIYKTKAQAFASVSAAQAEHSRALIARYEGIYRAQASRYDGYRAQVEAESARIQAVAHQNSQAVEMYKATTTYNTAMVQNLNSQWGAAIKGAEASSSIALSAAKANADAHIAHSAARLDASKVGAQVAAQLAASAMSMIHASVSVNDSASVSGSDTYNHSWTY